MFQEKPSDAQTLDKEKKSTDTSVLVTPQTRRVWSHLEKYGCIDGDVCRSIGAGKRCERRIYDLRHDVNLKIKTVDTCHASNGDVEWGTYCFLKEGDGCSECDGKLNCKHGTLTKLSSGWLQFDAPTSCKIKRDFVFTNTFDYLAMVKKDFNLFDEPISDVDGGVEK